MGSIAGQRLAAKQIAGLFDLASKDMRLPAAINRKDRRYWYAYASSPAEGQRLFVKLAKSEGATRMLAYEANATELAAKLGIPVMQVRQPFRLTEEGVGAVGLELADLRQSFTLFTDEAIAAADPSLGRQYADALYLLRDRQVPAELYSELLEREEEETADPKGFREFQRARSHAHFQDVWEEWARMLAESRHTGWRSEVISEPALASVLELARKDLGEAARFEEEGARYLAHNDLSPANILISRQSPEQTRFIDLEFAGVSQNRVLCWASEVGYLYAKLWPNPALQRELISSLIEGAPVAEAELVRQTVRIAIVFGTLFLARYALEPDHREHGMTVSLLESLQANLALAA